MFEDPDLEVMSLDDLFKEAKRHLREEKAREEKAAKEPRRAGKEKIEPSQLFANPDNYNRGKNVALVHRDSATLLGVFSEWNHKTVAGVRKLLRADEGLPIHQVEFVEGKGWLGEPPEVRAASERLPVFQVKANLTLMEIGTAFSAPVAVTMQGAGMLRVELLEAFPFRGNNGALLHLPPGTEIIRQLSPESKTLLRKEIELCQSK